ncbi:MAG TPA: NUDIX domain-containing protein [Bacteroidia bacterium]|nr:NUDIX domain-containing protein [Bacteroidia bacterium]
MPENIFNVRVYGICIYQNNILVTDELRYGHRITKFPGGGLQFGEGAIECLKRECREEFGQEVDVTEHFYTTDFFQPSAFNSKQQVISIYYFITIPEPEQIPGAKKQFDFPEENEGAQIFRWIPLKDLNENNFTFPIERKVSQLLIR